MITDPRTTFFVPDDRQVIVYFEWEAPRGTHHCEGTLRGPNGQLAVMSSFDYPATQARFGGYWQIPLLENTTAGVWTFESRVDGESAGTLSFEIVAGKTPANAIKQPPPLPTPAEIYARAVRASALIEKIDGKGRKFETASGFFIADGVLVTAFRAIDGARSLRVRLSDGTAVESNSILGWNRRQDWALLGVAEGKSVKLDKVDSKSAAVGDHCYWLVTKADGARVISDGQIVGKETHELWGDRLSISAAFDSTAIGGPVLDEHGDVLGLLGGPLPEPDGHVSGTTFILTGLVVPIGLVNASAAATPTLFQTLWTANQFTAPVTAERDISFAIITQGKPKGKAPAGKEMTLDFSSRDQFATITVAFQGIGSWKDTVRLQIYDVDNRPISVSNPLKVSLRSGETQERSWSFPLTLHPGIYRADVLVGEEVGWRKYFRINE